MCWGMGVRGKGAGDGDSLGDEAMRVPGGGGGLGRGKGLKQRGLTAQGWG